jgi:phosphate:Na+ symporter
MDHLPVREHRRPSQPVILALVTAGLMFHSHLALALDGEPGDVAWGFMAMNLLGGLALFLYGMDKMADALKAVAGDSMRWILATLTTNRFMGLITGAVVTSIIQSSSVTTVMLVGFVTAGLLSLSQAIGVILGADIGTTITAQIVAFKVTRYALILVSVGFLLIFISRAERMRQYGALVMGLGLIFFGMGVMSESMRPLRDYQPFIELMQNTTNPLFGILLATLFTALVQSSSATMGVVIALALQGLINLDMGIALALGANIGTCATAGLAAIGKPQEALRVAVAHVTFKIAGVLLIFPFIPELAEFVRAISPQAEAGVSEVDRLAAETPRQIANAHTIFNVGIALLFLPAAGLFARFCEWLVPDRPLEEDIIIRPRYLDEELLDTPSLALGRAQLEASDIGEQVEAMLEKVMPALLSRDRIALREVRRLDERVDVLHAATISYLGKLSKGNLTETQTRKFARLMEAVNNLESIGDIIETELVGLGMKLIDEDVVISPETRKVITNIHEAVSRSVHIAIEAVAQGDETAALTVIDAKDEVNGLTDSAALHESRRLVAEEPNRIAAYTIEMDIIEKLKRIYYFAKRMAKTVTEQSTQEATD